MKLIGLKYVGKKTRPQPDTVLNTKRVWPDTKHVEWVPQKDAEAYLKHPDVWAVSGEKNAPEDVADLLDLPEPDEKKEEIDTLAPLVQLESMSKPALVQFAQQHFGQRLHHAMSESTMRGKIRNWMNSPMAG